MIDSQRAGSTTIGSVHDKVGFVTTCIASYRRGYGDTDDDVIRNHCVKNTGRFIVPVFPEDDLIPGRLRYLGNPLIHLSRFLCLMLGDFPSTETKVFDVIL